MFCQNCGHKLEDIASFCPNCGCNVAKSAAAAFPVTTKEDFIAEPLKDATIAAQTAPIAESAPAAESVENTPVGKKTPEVDEVTAIAPPTEETVVVSESFSSELSTGDDVMAPTTDTSSSADYCDESAYPTSFPSEDEQAAGMLDNEITEENAEFKTVTEFYKAPLEDMGISEVTANTINEQVPMQYSGKPSVGVMARPMSTGYGTTAKNPKTYKGAAITFGILTFVLLIAVVLEGMLLFQMSTINVTKDYLSSVVDSFSSTEETAASITTTELDVAADSSETASSAPVDEPTETTTEPVGTVTVVERDAALSGIWSYLYNGDTAIMIIAGEKIYNYYDFILGYTDGYDYSTANRIINSDYLDGYSYRFVGGYLLLNCNGETLALTKIGEVNGGNPKNPFIGAWYCSETKESALFGENDFCCLNSDMCSYSFDSKTVTMISADWDLELKYSVSGDALTLSSDDGSVYLFSRIK